MEHTPSGTDDGQYWQPEGQQSAGYPPQPQQAPAEYPYPGYEQQGYQHDGYAQDPYYAQPGYQNGYPEQQQAQQPQQYYAQPSYQDPQAYPEQQQYQQQYQAQYQQYPQQPVHQEYSADPYAGSQGYYQPQEYQPTQQWSPSPDTQSYQANSYPDLAQPGAAEPDSTGPDTAGPDTAEPPVAEHRSAETPATAPRAAEPEPGEPAPADPALDAPLGKRLAAAATGRTPGTNRRSFLIRAAIGALALVVVAAAGYAVAGHGSGAKPTAGAAGADLTSGHTKSWSAPAETTAGGSSDGLLGAWILPTALIRGDGTGVSAYDADTGRKLWTLTPPTAGAVPCAMSGAVNTAGIGAVLFQAKPGNGQACTQLVAVDTAAGTAKWSAKIAATTAAYGASVMVNDTRAVAVGDSAAVGYDITNGKQSWSYPGPGKFCGALNGNGTGSTLLLESTCADTNPKAQAISLDAGTGKLVWWRGLPLNAASYTVLSASPPVVAVHMADPTKDSIMSFTAKGDSQAAINVAQMAGTLDSTHGSFDPDPALFFQGNTMIAEVSPTGTGAGTAGLLTAFTLADGKQLWQATPQEKGRSALVGIDGTAAVVATEERVGQQAKLSHYDLATGKEQPGGNFPTGTGSLLTSGRVVYRSALVAVLPEFTTTYGTSVTAFKAGGK